MDKTEYLKQLINDTGLKMKAFSEKADIPYTTLRSMLDRGIENASVNNVLKICKTLNISIETLYDKCNNNTFLMSEEEQQHIQNFRKLNVVGRKKVSTYTNDLMDSGKYEKLQTTNIVETPKKELWEEEGKEHLMPIAAHDDNLTDEEKNSMDKAIEEYFKKQQH